jgi:hypothetical protein
VALCPAFKLFCLHPPRLTRKNRFWKIAAGYLVIILVAGIPVWCVLISSYVAESNHCVLNEADAHPCIINGIDYGGELAGLFVMGWSFLVFFPLGLGALIFWTKQTARWLKVWRKGIIIAIADLKHLSRKEWNGMVHYEAWVNYNGEEKPLAIILAHRNEEQKLSRNPDGVVEGLLENNPGQEVMILRQVHVYRD